MVFKVSEAKPPAALVDKPLLTSATVVGSVIRFTLSNGTVRNVDLAAFINALKPGIDAKLQAAVAPRFAIAVRVNPTTPKDGDFKIGLPGMSAGVSMRRRGQWKQVFPQCWQPGPPNPAVTG